MSQSKPRQIPRFSYCLEDSLCVIQYASLTLQWKDIYTAYCSMIAGQEQRGHIFQEQISAALWTSLQVKQNCVYWTNMHSFKVLSQDFE